MAEDVEIFGVEIDARMQRFEQQMQKAANRTDAQLNKIQKQFATTNNRLRKGLEFRGLDARGERAMRDLDRRFRGLRSRLMGGAAMLGVSFGGAQLVSALREDEEAARRLASVLRTTGHAAGLSQRDIAAWAEELEQRTGRGAGEIQRVAAQLATFTSIGRDEFLRSIALADDLAATFGGDLQSNLDAVARALDDPIEGFANLRKRGFALSDAELARARAHLAAGNAAAAQGVVLDNLESQVRGAAEATNQGLTKALNDLRKQAQDTFTEFANQHGTDVAIAALETLAQTTAWAGENMDLLLNSGQAILVFMGTRYTVGVLAAGAGKLVLARNALAAKGAIEALSVAMAKNPATLVALGVAALAFGLAELDRRQREARASAAELRNANEALKASTDAYAQAAAAAAGQTGAGAKAARDAAKAKRDEAQANLESARAKLIEARATIAQIQAEAARINQFERYNIRGDRPGSLGSRITSADRERLRQAQEDEAAIQGSITEALAAIREADAILNSRGTSGIDYDAGGSDKSAARQAQQRRRLLEDLERQTQTEEAQLALDVARVRELERQAEITARIRQLEDAGLTAAQARVASDAIQTRLDQARADAMARELDLLEEQVELEAAQLDEAHEQVRIIERRIQREELLGRFKEVTAEAAEAERRTAEAMLRIDEARLNAARRFLSMAHEEHRIRVAELTGNRQLLRQLQDAEEIRQRTLRYRESGAFRTAGEAERQATDEVTRERLAATYGEHRDMFASAFSSGVRAALSGDLKGFLSNQFGDFADTAFKRLGEQAYDAIFGGVDAVTEGAARGAAEASVFVGAVVPAITGAGVTAGASMAAQIVAAGAAAGATMGAAIAGASAASGAANVAAVLSGLRGFDQGGYTGPGAKDAPAGVVHRGEVVWSQRDVARAGGVGTVEAMRRGLVGYANGGSVGVLPQVNRAVRAVGALANPVRGDGPTQVFDMRGAVVTEQLMRDVERKVSAGEARVRRDVPGIAISSVADARDRRIIS